MQRWRLGLTMMLTVAGSSEALAQPAKQPVTVPPATQGTDIVVTGTRDKPSGWREAETSHIVILSDGPENELIRLAGNIERLHFLLSGLMGRVDAPDQTVKLRVTLIGDVPEFQALDLQNIRWQQGPFADLFTLSRFYDPRGDGAVMATTRVDQNLTIERSQATPERVFGYLGGQTIGTQAPGPGAAGTTPADQAAAASALVGDFATAGMRGPHDLTVGTGEKTIPSPPKACSTPATRSITCSPIFPPPIPGGIWTASPRSSHRWWCAATTSSNSAAAPGERQWF